MEHNPSLLVYSPRVSGNRDAISLYFEVSGEESIIIHRYYYNEEELNSFFGNEINVNDNQQIDIREGTTTVDKDKFAKILFNFASKDELSFLPNSFSIKLKEVVKNISSINKQKSLSDIIDEINDCFFGYQYLTKNNKHYINKNLINKINQMIDVNDMGKCADKNNIKPKFDERFQTDELMQLRIYSVGQANCSALIKFKDITKDDYDVVAVFDFGFQKSIGKNKKLNEMIDKINQDTTIIISHFDYDHINNITAYDRTKTCRWLFPEHEPKKKRANMLYAALLKIVTKKSLSGMPLTYKTPYKLSNFLEIHQNTTGKHDSYQSTVENAECIIATLSLGDKRILIPADALYKDFPDSILKNFYTDIIIPHHCCYYINKCIDPKYYPLNKLVSSCKRAYIMSGRNKHGHANIDHLSWYNNVKIFKFTNFFNMSKILVTPPISKVTLVSDDYIKIE